MSLISDIRPEGVRGQARSLEFARWSAILGGGAMALLGLSRRSKTGLAVAAAGGIIAYGGVALDWNAQGVLVESSFALNCTPEKAYQFWRNFENLPRFMRNLESVTVIDNRHSEWSVMGRFGKSVRWTAEIVDERKNEWIVWHSLPGSDLDLRGSTHFRSAPGNRGTLITASIQYGSPAGASVRAIARILGKDPEFMMREDLRRFKALIEAGEVPTIDGQTHGPRSVLVKTIQEAYPERRKPSEFETGLRQLRVERSAS
ncbi:MAG: cyclase [Acidobacteria bacterium]|nr:MAG: cyclase [Acidobacteriota bacterium]